MVVNRINEYEGEIVYGRARSVPPEEAEIPAERIDEGCRSYIGCLAHIRIGTKLPIPDARWSSVAISQHLQSHWRAPELADVRQLPEIIDAYKIGYSGLVAARDAGTRTGALAEAKIRKAEQMIRYLRLRCQELSRNANFPTACPKT
jgi:hypothetical protein